jgi:hypothetical protein
MLHVFVQKMTPELCRTWGGVKIGFWRAVFPRQSSFFKNVTFLIFSGPDTGDPIWESILWMFHVFFLQGCFSANVSYFCQKNQDKAYSQRNEYKNEGMTSIRNRGKKKKKANYKKSQKWNWGWEKQRQEKQGEEESCKTRNENMKTEVAEKAWELVQDSELNTLVEDDIK